MHKTLTIVLLILSLPSMAGDVFQQHEPRPFRLGDPLEINATIGDYPIWNGEGQWQLFGIKRYDSTGSSFTAQAPMGSVSLFQIEDKKFVASMEVKANLEQGFAGYWSDEPCKRDDMLLKKSLAKNFKEEYCITINHYTGFLANPSGVYADLYAFIRRDGVDIPPTVLRITFTRNTEKNRWLSVALTINPELAGFPRDSERWARSAWHKSQAMSDPKKSQFIESLTAWAMMFANQMDDAFGKNAQAFSGIPSWRSIYAKKYGLDTHPSSVTAPTTSSGSTIGKPDVAERLRRLDVLYKENLISLDDYERKKREILNDM